MSRKPDAPVKPRRFWRCDRSLPAVIWNPKIERPLVEFSRGTVLVTDDAIAERLLREGYREVPVDSVELPVPMVSTPAIPGISMAGAPVPVPPVEMLPPDVQIPQEMLGKDSRPKPFMIGE